MLLTDRQFPALRAHAARRGFTLTELLVVIGIIVALVALLIPALSHVRKKGRDSGAQSLLAAIGQALDTYHTTFGAYPGPMPSILTADTGAKTLSGAQNMLMGLSYSMYDAATAPVGSLALPNGYAVDATTAIGPKNLASRGPTGAYDQLKPFYSIAPSKISPMVTPNPPTYPNGGFKGIDAGVGNNFKFPVLLDNYPDALPILYYRRSGGVLNPVAADDDSTTAAYYLRDNYEYTHGKLEVGGDAGTPGSGTVYDQTDQKDSGGKVIFQSLRSKDIELLALENGAAPRARGGFVLISAGADRLFGGVPDSSDPVNRPTVNDNIVVVGGN